MTLAKSIIVVGAVTGIVTAVYGYLQVAKSNKRVDNLKKESTHWQGLYYDNITQDNIAWG